uniref:Putative ixostatin n=1 Tax=Ixodes ricinus TaxID=34613 RepID=A0A0K8RCF1_IXORI
MNEATFLILVTSQLFYDAASEYKRWADVEQTFGVPSCWEKLGEDLDKACIKGIPGSSGAEKVDFAACKMQCKVDVAEFFDQKIPDDTPCGFFGEVCKNGTCQENCNIHVPSGCLRRPVGH